MSEVLKKKQKVTLISIRHGEPKKYTNVPTTENPYDLTEKGIEQAKQTARKLFEKISNYEQVWVISSPALRAKSTANFFIEEFNRLLKEIKSFNKLETLKLNKTNRHSMRPMDIYKFIPYIEYINQPTDFYGENWLLKDDHAKKGSVDFVESREEVEGRAIKLIERYINWLEKKSQETGKKVALIMFNHFEIGTPLIRGVYTENSKFPLVKKEINTKGDLKKVQDKEPQNYAEPILIEIIDSKSKQYKISLPERNLTQDVELDSSNISFIHLK